MNDFDLSVLYAVEHLKFQCEKDALKCLADLRAAYESDKEAQAHALACIRDILSASEHARKLLERTRELAGLVI